jgi:DNA-binding response OmpR family regulator
MENFMQEMEMPYKVLVVDDNELNLDLISKILELVGYEAAIADNGQDALKKIVEFRPDLALLDVMMPDMDGFELCRRLRQLPESANMPVLMLTASSGEDDRIRAKKVGANDLLGKPFNVDVLDAHIKALLLK